MNQKTIIIVVEKPQMARNLAPHARAHWPTERIITLSVIPYGNITFAYPRGQALRDYPRLDQPVTKIASWDKLHPQSIDAEGKPSPCEMTDAIFQNAETIVSACDPDHTGALAFATLIESQFQSLDAREFPFLFLFSIDDESIKSAFSGMTGFKVTCRRLLEQGRVKRYFDWNWNANALVILGATARAVGVAQDAPPLSKYSLQLLYLLCDAPEGLRPIEIIFQMTNWRGTGRYVAGGVSLGSPVSFGQILENLLAARLISKTADKQKQCQITPLGRTLLSKLHKDCRDADLPFRIQAWCELDYADAKPSIDRYLNTFFGKQKRFLAA